MFKVFTILFLIFVLANSTRLRNVVRTSSHVSAYDVEMTEIPIHPLDDSDTILQYGSESLIFESSNRYNINEYITEEFPNGFYDFLGQIVNTSSLAQENPRYSSQRLQYTAIRVPISNLIRSGRITIIPISNTENGEVVSPFCFGFNTESCAGPSTTFPLFANQFMTATCDNCFLGFSGEAFVSIEFDLFKVKHIEAGFKNLALTGGVGVNLVSSRTWSYTFTRTYPVVKQFDLATFYIGLVKIHAYIEIPVEVDFSASASFNAQVRFGDKLQAPLGGLYFDYTPGSGVSIVKPSPSIKITPYFGTSVSGTGNAQFKIIPSINFHVNDLFRFSTTLNPEIDGNLWGSLESRELCVSGQYRFSAAADGEIITYQLPSTTIFDIGSQTIGTICEKF